MKFITRHSKQTLVYSLNYLITIADSKDYNTFTKLVWCNYYKFFLTTIRYSSVKAVRERDGCRRVLKEQFYRLCHF